MITPPTALLAEYTKNLNGRGFAEGVHYNCRKWFRFYWDFCAKYRHDPQLPESLPPFLEKLKAKNQTTSQLAEAKSAIALFLQMNGNQESCSGEALSSKTSSPVKVVVKKSEPTQEMVTGKVSGASWVGEFSRMSEEIALRHYSPKTLRSYLGWMRKLQTFTKSKSPELLTTEDVKAFLTNLAVRHSVAASTQNQAFNALLFFFRHVLQKDFGKIDGVVRAKRSKYIPVVLSRAEVDRIVKRLASPRSGGEDFIWLRTEVVRVSRPSRPGAQSRCRCTHRP